MDGCPFETYACAEMMPSQCFGPTTASGRGGGDTDTPRRSHKTRAPSEATSPSPSPQPRQAGAIAPIRIKLNSGSEQPPLEQGQEQEQPSKRPRCVSISTLREPLVPPLLHPHQATTRLRQLQAAVNKSLAVTFHSHGAVSNLASSDVGVLTFHE